MKLSPFALAAVGVVGLASGVYWFVAGNSLPPPDESSFTLAEGPEARRSAASQTEAKPTAGERRGTGQDAAALRSEMANLRAELAALRQQVRTLQMAQADANRASDNADKKPSRDPASRAEAERERQEQMAAVEAGFRTEPVDERWSSQTVPAVQGVLARDSAVQALVRGVECRSRTCRVELANDTSGALDKSLPVLVQQMGDSLPSVTASQMDDGSGGTATVLYMSRDAGEPPPE